VRNRDFGLQHLIWPWCIWDSTETQTSLFLLSKTGFKN
jgi:hypothetical protein